MTKGELRKARKEAKKNGLPLTGELSIDQRTDRNDNDPIDFSPERNRDGSYNLKRARALERYARFVYDYDRD